MERRLQVDFSDRAYKQLEELQKKLDAKTKSDLIRQALAVLSLLYIEVVEQKGQLWVDGEGFTRRIDYDLFGCK